MTLDEFLSELDRQAKPGDFEFSPLMHISFFIRASDPQFHACPVCWLAQRLANGWD